MGSYVYQSQDPEGKLTDHEWDRLTLQEDGKYDLVQGGPTKSKTETVGRWTLWNGGGGGPTVDLDHSGYPVRVKGGEVRLMIDYDTGIWYSKANEASQRAVSSEAVLLRLEPSIGSCTYRKKSTLPAASAVGGHTTPDRVPWSNEKLRLRNLLKTGG